MSYTLQPVHDPKPPFLLTHYNTVCELCAKVWEGHDNPTTLPSRCPGCKPLNKTHHPLAPAHNAHLRCAYQPITTDWNEWVKSPYQVSNTIHPKYAEYRRSKSDLDFKHWLGFQTPITPADYDIDYDLSVSGLSYEQWLNTPPELISHLKRDWKLSGSALTFKEWTNAKRPIRKD